MMTLSPAETATTKLETSVHPRLAGMAAVYGLEVNIDEEAVTQALPHLVLPGTEPGPLKLKAELQHRSLFKDAYWLQRTTDENEIEGAELTVYYREKDVRSRNGHPEIVLPALKEAINQRNPSLQRLADRYVNHRTTEAFLKFIAAVGVPAGLAVWGGQEINGVSQDLQEVISIYGGMGAAALSGAATLRYGIYYGHKADLRRSPYQHMGEPIPADLPPIVNFKPQT